MNQKYKIGLSFVFLVVAFFAGRISNMHPDKVTTETHVSSSDQSLAIHSEAEKMAKEMLKEWQKNLKRTINRTVSASGDVTESIVEESSESSKELESVLFERNRLELAETLKKYELLQKTVAEYSQTRIFFGLGLSDSLKLKGLIGGAGKNHGAVLTKDAAETAAFYTFGVTLP